MARLNDLCEALRDYRSMSAHPKVCHARRTFMMSFGTACAVRGALFHRNPSVILVRRLDAAGPPPPQVRKSRTKRTQRALRPIDRREERRQAIPKTFEWSHGHKALVARR